MKIFWQCIDFETLWVNRANMFVSTKFTHREITWHYGILFRAVIDLKRIETPNLVAGRICRRWIAMKCNLTRRNCLYSLLFMNNILELIFYADDATCHPLEINLNYWCIQIASNSWSLLRFEINDSKTKNIACLDKNYSV